MSDSFGLSDKQQDRCIADVRFFEVIGQAAERLHCGCPIHSGYRTSSRTDALRMSDSFGLSDKQQNRCIVDVRFIRVIGQAAGQMHCGCPNHSGYRTSSGTDALWLSDSFWLSDKQQNRCIVDVRFFEVIGQAAGQMHCGCPIHSGYRTSSGTDALWLSDSFWLSDKQQNRCIVDVRFIRVIGHPPAHMLSRCPSFCFILPACGPFLKGKGFRTKIIRTKLLFHCFLKMRRQKSG
ncbi:hypothetical protein [uncultured Trichococcus sp.]|uniref:hypothetical protein n=1 Tax=uncultured Trichococcus sp. TaxID=189665 RepID=UPI0029C7CAB4|nr:hypothetical protein [uncultured Trichococcus sp.]